MVVGLQIICDFESHSGEVNSIKFVSDLRQVAGFSGYSGLLHQ